MSQHIYKTKIEDKEVEVLMGWDSPLQRFFLVISYVNDIDFNNDDDDNPFPEIIYSNSLDKNLPDTDPKYYSLVYFKQILTDYNLTVPDQLFDNLHIDKVTDAGNKTVHYK